MLFFVFRYAYHLRRWLLEGKGVGSHVQLVGDKGAVLVRVVIQPAGYHEKVTLELYSSDYVADLRAEVAKWWETIQVRFQGTIFPKKIICLSPNQNIHLNLPIYRVI